MSPRTFRKVWSIRFAFVEVVHRSEGPGMQCMIEANKSAMTSRVSQPSNAVIEVGGYGANVCHYIKACVESLIGIVMSWSHGSVVMGRITNFDDLCLL